MARTPQLLGRAPGDAARWPTRRPTGWRSTASRTTPGTPVYVHAKVCVDRRRVGHHRLRQLQPAVVDARLRAVRGRGRPERRGPQPTPGGCGSPWPPSTSTGRSSGRTSLLDLMADCVDPAGMFAAYAESAAALDDWHDGGRSGERPPGRLRRLEPPSWAGSSGPRRSCPTWSCTTPTAAPGRCAARAASERFLADPSQKCALDAPTRRRSALRKRRAVADVHEACTSATAHRPMGALL